MARMRTEHYYQIFANEVLCVKDIKRGKTKVKKLEI
jgi:hypothetical protein